MLDENTRAQVISDIGLKWRTFRTTLTTKYILPFKDNPELLVEPPTKYKFIDKLVWTEFVQSRLTPEFQVYIYFYRLLVEPHHCTHSHNTEHTTHSKPLHCSTPLHTTQHTAALQSAHTALSAPHITYTAKRRHSLSYMLMYVR